MDAIGPNDNGLDSERWTFTRRLGHGPKIVNVFGQEFPAAFQQRHREKERASWNKGFEWEIPGKKDSPLSL
jgi:hypothetical protein